MIIFKPQFRATVEITFEEHDHPRRRRFVFGNDGIRWVPMKMDGVESLNSIGLQISGSGEFIEGDKIEVDCQLIWLEGFRNVLKPGVKFKLWDAGFFATGVVTKKFDSAW